MIDGATGRACSTAGKPPQYFIILHPKVDQDWTKQPALKPLSQPFRLGNGSREPVEEESVLTVRPPEAVPNHAAYQIIRRQLARSENTLHLQTQRRFPRDLLP